MNGWMTMAGAAKYASVSKPTMRHWMKDGLKHSRVAANVVRIKAEDVDAYLERFTGGTNEFDEAIQKGLSKVRKMMGRVRA